MGKFVNINSLYDIFLGRFNANLPFVIISMCVGFSSQDKNYILFPLFLAVYLPGHAPSSEMSFSSRTPLLNLLIVSPQCVCSSSFSILQVQLQLTLFVPYVCFVLYVLCDITYVFTSLQIRKTQRKGLF